MAADLGRHVDHVGVLVGVAPRRCTAPTTEGGALATAARMTAELCPHVHHPGLFVGGTHCRLLPQVAKAGRECASPKVVAALPEEILRPIPVVGKIPNIEVKCLVKCEKHNFCTGVLY